MGKVEAGKLAVERCPFRLAEVVADAALFSVIAHQKGVEFVEDIGSFYPGVLSGDRLRLRQVLANGLSNAVKFTKRGWYRLPLYGVESLIKLKFLSSGSITLQMRQESETDTQATVLFCIKDTGCGIDAKVLPTLFVPFQ